MSQSHAQSILEALTNTVVGFALAFVTNGVMLASVGVAASVTQNAAIVGGHTVVSLVRSYIIRRYFNRKASK
jgi:uncharacterized protein (DUF697 family)